MGRVAFGGIAAGVILAATSLSRFKDDQIELSRVLTGTGRDVGLTGAAFSAMAERAAAAGQVSVRSATDLGLALAQTGKVGPENIEKIIGLSKRMAVTFGTDADGIKEKLVQAFADPLEGIEALNRQLRFLNPAELDKIATLLRQGRTQEGIAAALERMPAALSNMDRSTAASERIWNALKVTISDADVALGKWLNSWARGETMAEGFSAMLKQDQDDLRRVGDGFKSLGLAIDETLAKWGRWTERKMGLPNAPDEPPPLAITVRPRLRTVPDDFDGTLARQKELTEDLNRQDAAEKALTKSINEKVTALQKFAQIGDQTTSQQKAYREALDGIKSALEGGTEAERERIRVQLQSLGILGDLTEAQKRLQRAVETGGATEDDKRLRTMALELQIARETDVVRRAELERRKTAIAQEGQLISAERAAAEQQHIVNMARAQGEQQLAQMGQGQRDQIALLELERSMLGRTREERELALARMQAEQELRQQGLSTLGASADAYIRNAEAIALQRIALDKSRDAQRQVLEGQRATADSFKGLVEEMVTGSGKIEDALASIGKRYISMGLDALFTGTGPLGNAFGMGGSREKMGGLLGGLSGTGSASLPQTISTSVTTGVNDAASTIRTAFRENVTSGVSDALARAATAIKAIESSGNYGALGPVTKSGDRAYGAYQVMGNNVPSWTRQTLGYSMTPQEFLVDKKAQDAVFLRIFGGYMDKFNGSVAEATSMWHRGLPLAQSQGARDQLGTRTVDYARRVESIVLRGGTLPGISVDSRAVGDAVQEGAKTGSQAGVESGLPIAFRNVTGGGAATAGGASGVAQGGTAADASMRNVLGGIGGVLGIAGAYGVGAQSQSPVMAALGGGLSGLVGGMQLGSMIGMGPAGAVVGAAVGGLLGIFGQANAKKKAEEKRLKEARQRLNEAMPAIVAQREQWQGIEFGATGSKIRESKTQLAQMTKLTIDARDAKLTNELIIDQSKYANKLSTDFIRSFLGMVDALKQGVGPSGPFLAAKTSIEDLGKSLQGFVQDTIEFVGWQEHVDSARNAAIYMALGKLLPEQEMSGVQTELLRIEGTALGLVNVLSNLGLGMEDAGRVISDFKSLAIDQLKATFEQDWSTKLNDASGRGYINDLATTIKEYETGMADAMRLGVSSATVSDYLTAAAQSIVDDSELTGDAFAELANLFPALGGRIHEFVEDAAAAAQKLDEIAARRLGYEDRTFAATTDTTTLAGQLAAADRSATRNRADELKAGNEAIVDLERALAAERLKIEDDYAKAVRDRVQGYEDRAFAAANDSTTEAGLRAAMARTFERELAAETDAAARAVLQGAQASELAKALTSLGDQAKAAADQIADELASRRLGYDDRTFAAGNDTTKLSGQIAAQERKSTQERADEMKAGGELMASLEAAQAAERLQIVRDYGRQALDEARQIAQQVLDTAQGELQSRYDDVAGALQGASDRLRTFARSIREFREGMLLTDSSSLSPRDKVAEAQRQFRETFAQAGAGDATAMDRLQTVSQAYLDAARSYYASSESYYAAFDEVRTSLAAAEAQAVAGVDYAAAQLDALNRQVDGLVTISTGVDRVDASVREVMAAVGSASNYVGMVSQGVDATTSAVFGAAATIAGDLAGVTASINSVRLAQSDLATLTAANELSPVVSQLILLKEAGALDAANIRAALLGAANDNVAATAPRLDTLAALIQQATAAGRGQIDVAAAYGPAELARLDGIWATSVLIYQQVGALSTISAGVSDRLAAAGAANASLDANLYALRAETRAASEANIWYLGQVWGSTQENRDISAAGRSENWQTFNSILSQLGMILYEIRSTNALVFENTEASWQQNNILDQQGVQQVALLGEGNRVAIDSNAVLRRSAAA